MIQANANPGYKNESSRLALTIRLGFQLILMTLSCSVFGQNGGTESDSKSRIFFARKVGNDQGWSILSIDPRGMNERTEVAYVSGQGEYNPTVALDGRTLLFNTYRYGGWKLASLSLGSKEAARLDLGSGYDTNASISADGQFIVYEKSTRAGVGLHLVKRDGSNNRPLLTSLKQSNQRVPVWTPDGKYIVFFSDHEGANQLYRVELKTGTLKRLSQSSGNDFAPAVSPSGEHIAFYSDRDGHADLFVMHADGSLPMNLTQGLRGPDTEYAFSDRSYWVLKCGWSPDGKELVFISPVDGNYELHVIGADGSGIRRITTTSASELTPFWAGTEQE